MQGRIAFGERAGAHVLRLRDENEQTLDFGRGELCVDVEGFSLHAKVRVAACARSRLEKLCRYVLRPALAQERLSVLPDGRVLYRLKRRYRDGSTAVVLPPLVLLERLAALVPRPRRHLVTYHGVLAPAAAARRAVVPAPAAESAADTASMADVAACPAHPLPAARVDDGSATTTTHSETPPSSAARRPRRRYSWPDLMARVFGVDVLLCPCGGRRRVLEFIVEPFAIRRILRHVGLPEDPPPAAPARAPPASLFWTETDEGA